MSSNSNPSFYVKSSDNAFTDRQKNIFDQLIMIEEEKRQSSSTDKPEAERGTENLDKSIFTVASVRQKRRETKHFRGKESIFKRPDALPTRFKARDIPDYQRHPDKWTKYTLADVSNDDMSEKSNTATAMAFLKELASRKNCTPKTECEDFGKIEFRARKKPDVLSLAPKDSNTLASEEKGAFKDSKLVMPEYVVGQNKKKDMKRTKRPSDSTDKRCKEIKLSHLDDEDE